MSKSEKLASESASLFKQNLLDASIEKAEIAIGLDSTNKLPYKIILAANVQLGNWEEAKKYSDKATHYFPTDSLVNVNAQLAITKCSKLKPIKLLSIALAVGICLIWAYLFYANYSGKENPRANSLFNSLLISLSFTGILYSLFFYMRVFIRSSNEIMDLDTITPMVRPWLVERDGMESYFLFAASFLVIFISFAWFYILKAKKIPDSIKTIISVLSAVVTFWFMVHAYIIPPLPYLTGPLNLFYILIAVAGILIPAIYLLKYNPGFSNLWFCLILIVVCFIPINEISTFDYGYIYMPAYKMILGIEIKDIYFQYDLFLSLLAMLWMKSNFDLYQFQELGRVSFYLAFIALLFFSQKIFKNHWLSFAMIISIIIVRIYASSTDSVAIFQITPLRLDLWILLVVAIYYWGAYHWVVGLLLGIILILHRNFGMLYFAAYFVFIALNWLSSIFSQEDKFTHNLPQKLLNFLRLISPSLVFFTIGILVNILLFGSLVSDSAILYQKFGIGMIPINKTSFFWYVLALVGFGLTVVLQNRTKMGEAYFRMAMFLIPLTVSNSMYFFGRSHEHNLINLSMIYLFLLFVIMDVLITYYSEFPFKKRIVSMAAFAFPFIAAALYSGKIIDKTTTQWANIKDVKFIYPTSCKVDFTTIKTMTKNSSKVIFLDPVDDFQYYYFGKYVPDAYFSPFSSWVIKKDLTNYLNAQVANGYYLIFHSPNPSQPLDFSLDPGLNEIVKSLKFAHMVEKNGYIFLSNHVD